LLNSIDTAKGIYARLSGFENTVAKYWKNGSPVILGDVSKKSEAYCIFLGKEIGYTYNVMKI
jgi:hypothetical protein